MLSRVAENLYWTSRYIERTATLARLLEVGFELELDAAELGREPDAGPLSDVAAVLGLGEVLGTLRGDPDEMLEALTFDRTRPESIIAMIAVARENARGTQETLSAEVWSQINRLYLALTGTKARRRYSASPPRFFDRVRRACLLVDGMIETTLPRDEVYHFLRLGRCLERADVVTRAVATRCAAGDGPTSFRLVGWTSLLRSLSAYEAYLRIHRDRLDAESVVGFLLLDPDLPRSLRYTVGACLESLRAIAGGEDDYASGAERQLGRLDGELRYVDATELIESGLSRRLAEYARISRSIGDEIHGTYFSA